MIVDELVLKLSADISDLQKKLDAIDKQAEQKGKSLGDKLFGGLKSIAPQIAGVFAVSKIGDFFSTAIKNAQKFEQSMLKAESAAKAFGQSVRGTKSQVQDLASDGFLTLEQSARSMQLALSAGFSTKEAGRFITALKDISAQGNIIGDAGQSIEDFFKGVLTNSADLIENINPQIRKINTEYQKLKTTVGEAKAQQFLYNETLKFSTLFQGDAARYLNTSEGALKRLNAEYRSFSTEIGRTVEPIFAKFVNLIAMLVSELKQASIAIREFFESFSKSSGEKLIDEKIKLEGVAKAAGLTADEKTRLAAVNAQISREYDKYLKQLGQENASLETQANLIQKIDMLKKLSIKDLEARIKKTNDELIRASRATQENAFFNTLDVILPGGATGQAFKGQRINEVARLGQEKALQENVLADLVAEIEKSEKQIKKAGGKTTKADPFGFREARDELVKLGQEYAKFLAQNKKLSDEQRELAKADFQQRQQTIVRELRTSIATYNEETLAADKLANQQAFNNELANLDRLLVAKQLEEGEYEKKKQALRESFIKKNTEAELAAVARTAQAAAGIAGGFGTTMAALRSGDNFGALAGVGQSVGAVNPIVGSIVSSVAGVGSALASIFGKSEEQRRQDEETAQRQREEQIKIAELQSSYVKAQLEIQKAAAETPFKNLEKDLRLVDIRAQIAELGGADREVVKIQALQEKLGLISGTLQAESGTIAQGSLFTNTVGTAESLTDLLKQVQEQGASVTALSQYMSQVAQITNFTTGTGFSSSFNTALVQSIASNINKFNVPQELKAAALGQFRSQLTSFANSFYNISRFGRTEQDTAQYRNVISTITSATAGASSGSLSGLLNELTIDTTRAENLLTLIQSQNQTQLEIAANTGKTAENTTKIALREDRQRAFVDIFGGSITAAEGTIRTNNTLPQSIGSAIAITRQTDSIYERIARTGEVTNEILRDIRFLMKELLKANDNNNITNTGITVEQFAALDAEFTRLSR